MTKKQITDRRKQIDARQSSAIPNMPNIPPPPPETHGHGCGKPTDADMAEPPPPKTGFAANEAAITAEIKQRKVAAGMCKEAERMLLIAIGYYEQAAAETMRTDFNDGLRLATFTKAMRVQMLQFKVGGQS